MTFPSDKHNLFNDTETITRSLSLAEDAAQTPRGMILLEKLPPGTALFARNTSQTAIDLRQHRTTAETNIELAINEINQTQDNYLSGSTSR